MSSAVIKPLSLQIRSELFSQLAAMESAGLPFDKALNLLKLPAQVQARIGEMRRWARLGLSIGDAGLRSGLFTSVEAAIVKAASLGGSPAATYRRLASTYAHRAAQQKAMKSRMGLPLAIFVLSAFVQPLPQLVAGLSLGAYLLKALRPLAALAVLAYVVAALPRFLRGDPKSATRQAVARVLLAMPMFGPIHARRNARDFFEGLAMLVEGGVPILQALPVAEETIWNPIVAREFRQIKPRIEAGADLAGALSGLLYTGRSRALPMIVAGEASGSLPALLRHYADSETASIDRFDAGVAEWVPRIIYSLSAASIAYGILSGPGFGPRLPEELR